MTRYSGDILPLSYEVDQEISLEHSQVYTAYKGENRRIVKIYESPKSQNALKMAMEGEQPGEIFQAELAGDTAHWQGSAHPNMMPILETAVIPRPTGLGWTVYEYMPQLVELEEHLDFCPPTEETYRKIARDTEAGLVALGRPNGQICPEHLYFDGENYVVATLPQGTGNDVTDWGRAMYWMLNNMELPKDFTQSPPYGDTAFQNLVMQACQNAITLPELHEILEK